MKMEKELRDITLQRARSYVAQLTGASATAGGYSGPDWRIDLTELEPLRIGPMEFMRVRFVLHADASIAARVWQELMPRFLRGGA